MSGGHSLDYAENVCTHLRKSLPKPPLLQIPSMTPASIYSFVCIQSGHRAGRHLVRKHKRHKTSQSETRKNVRIRLCHQRCKCKSKERHSHRSNAPCGIPLEVNQYDQSITRVLGESDGRTEPGWKSDIEKQIFLS